LTNGFCSGPPGVGKTLTAETLSEHLQRPLYSVRLLRLRESVPKLTWKISAGELGEDAAVLEMRLTLIFRLTSHWKALVLLDEADVFVQERSLNHTSNGLVSVFLRRLEYYQGVMFLTTNRVTTFDNAIKSRITIALKYDSLPVATRRTIWEEFLKKATTTYGPVTCKSKQLEKLAEMPLNGRQVSSYPPPLRKIPLT
jgi:AAA+ superfamily predicted ATPase